MFSRGNARACVALPFCMGAGVLLLTGCMPTLTISTQAIDPKPAVSITASPQSGTGIDPDTQVVIEAELGRLTQVMVLGPEGEVPGILSEPIKPFTVSRYTHLDVSLEFFLPLTMYL